MDVAPRKEPAVKERSIVRRPNVKRSLAEVKGWYWFFILSVVDFVVELWGTGARRAEAPQPAASSRKPTCGKVPPDVLNGRHRHAHYSVNALSLWFSVLSVNAALSLTLYIILTLLNHLGP